MTCSKLSRTRSTVRGASHSARISAIGRLPDSTTPAAEAILAATSCGSRIGSSGTKKTPPGKRSAIDVASSSDSRVLPVPPGPVSVSSLVDVRRSRAAASSSARPMNVVSWVGRFDGRSSSVFGAGKVVSRPSTSSWFKRSGLERSRRRNSPRSRNATPAGSAPATSARVASLSRICPPCAAAAMRAARLMSRPTSDPPAVSGSPVWMPIRTRTGASSGHGSAASARCAATAAPTAARALANTTKNESPSVPCSSPPACANAARRSARCRSRSSP